MAYMDRLQDAVDKRAAQLVNSIVRRAAKGDVRAHVYLRDTLFGVPKQSLEVAQGDNPMLQLLANLTGNALAEKGLLVASDGEIAVAYDGRQVVARTGENDTPTATPDLQDAVDASFQVLADASTAPIASDT